MGIEIAFIVLLILANGFFAASEIALVSARRSRLQQQAQTGKRSAQQALDLAEHPDRFLATIQIGITVISTFAAAFSGASISHNLAGWLSLIPPVAPYAEPLAFGIVVAGVSYLSLVVGELAPKRLALQHAERIAMLAAPVMNGLARFARPAIALLSGSVTLVLRLLGQRQAAAIDVTEEDVVFLARQGTVSGAIEPEEAQFIHRVFQFTDRPAHTVMTPRSEIVAVEVETPIKEVVQVFLRSRYSRLPVYEGSLDRVLGMVNAKDVLQVLVGESSPDLRSLIYPALFVPEHQPINDLLTIFRQKGAHLALVIDAYGQVSGLLTLEDVLEELVGEIQDEYDMPEDLPLVQRADGSWLADGAESYETVQETVGLPPIPPEERGLYTTLAGVVLARLGHIPRVGEQIEIGPYVLEVVDMDGRRIDRILILPEAAPNSRF